MSEEQTASFNAVPPPPGPHPEYDKRYNRMPIDPPRRVQLKPWVLGVMVGGIFLVGYAAGEYDPAPRPVAQPPQVSAPAEAPAVSLPPAQPAPTGPASTFGDGVHLVGRDVLPGEYRSDGAESTYCGWSVANSLKIGTTGKQDAPQLVVLEADERITSNGCGVWTLLDG